MCRADMPAAPVPRPGPVAALNCLLLHYGVPDEVLPVAERPSLVLSAESELGITAGLQDRVIQVRLSYALRNTTLMTASPCSVSLCHPPHLPRPHCPLHRCMVDSSQWTLAVHTWRRPAGAAMSHWTQTCCHVCGLCTVTTRLIPGACTAASRHDGLLVTQT